MNTPRLFALADAKVQPEMPLKEVGKFLSKLIGFREVDGNEDVIATLLEMERFLIEKKHTERADQ